MPRTTRSSLSKSSTREPEVKGHITVEVWEGRTLRQLVNGVLRWFQSRSVRSFAHCYNFDHRIPRSQYLATPENPEGSLNRIG